MEGPGELIRRAANRPGRMAHPPGERRENAPLQEESLPVPQPISRHGSYTALMRSHDRVHTRHIAVKG